MPQNDQIWPDIGIFFILGQALLAHLVLCWWLWRAGCISQDTYLLYQDNTRVFLLVAAVGVNSLAQAFPHNEVVALQAGRQEEGVPDDDDSNGNVNNKKVDGYVVLQTHSHD